MSDGLIEVMRHCVADMNCATCPVGLIDEKAKAQQRCLTLVLEKAADEIEALSKKLTAYEDAAKEGRLKILPNKIGDHVFLAYRGRVEKLEIGNVTDNVFYTRNIETGDRSVDIYPNDFGRYIFQTKEEAEAALPKGGH